MAVNHPNKNAYIDHLENKVMALENEVRNLQSKIVLLHGKKHSKKKTSCTNGMTKMFTCPIQS
jgi:peptidoglycan hydrolase CwlO-like protein